MVLTIIIFSILLITATGLLLVVISSRNEIKQSKKVLLQRFSEVVIERNTALENLNDCQKNKSIASVVGSLQNNAINKEQKEIDKIKTVKEIARKIKTLDSLSQEEIDDFWKWVDSEVAKMTDEEREELQKLIK